MAVTGGIALVSGILALILGGVAKTVAACVFGISLAAFSLPLLQVFVVNPLKDEKIHREYKAKYEAERTPLIIAVEKKDIKKIKKLIKKGADVNEGKGYRTPLITACERGNSYDKAEYEEIARILLEAGAEPDLFRDESWWYEYSSISFNRVCAMPVAIAKGREGIVKLLIEHGANVDSYEESDEVDEKGKKVLIGKPFLPFQWALSTCSYGCAKLILDAGAKTGFYMYGYNSEYGKNEKKTVLMELFAGYEGDYNIEAKVYVLSKVLEKCDEEDVNRHDDKGKTALHWAATAWEWEAERTRLAALLVDAGADVNAKDDEGKTPLMYVVKEVRLWHDDASEPVSFFVSRGADITLKDKNGKTALELFTARYADKELDGREKENYDKIVEMLTAKKAASQKELEKTKAGTEAGEPARIAKADFAAGKHTELADIADNW